MVSQALGNALLVVVLLLGNLRKHLEALLDLARLVGHESGVLVTRAYWTLGLLIMSPVHDNAANQQSPLIGRVHITVRSSQRHQVLLDDAQDLVLLQPQRGPMSGSDEGPHLTPTRVLTHTTVH